MISLFKFGPVVNRGSVILKVSNEEKRLNTTALAHCFPTGLKSSSNAKVVCNMLA